MKLTLGKALQKGFINRLRTLGRSSDDKAAPVVQVIDQGVEAKPFDDIEKRRSTAITHHQDLPLDQLQPIIQLFTQGKLQQALVNATKTLEEFPNSAVLYNISGACYAGLMQFEAAINAYSQALIIKPDYSKAHNNMAIALNAKGDSEAALASCEKALEIEPNNADAYNNMANILKGRGDLEAAVNSYKQALIITADDAEVYNNMGIALSSKGDLDAALESYKQALIIQPDYAEAYFNKGTALVEKGVLDAGIRSYEMALKINPSFHSARAQKLHQQSHICDWSSIEQDRDHIAHLGTSTEAITPFIFHSLEDAPERHRIRSEAFFKKSFGCKTPLPLIAPPLHKPKRLRIGYFSADFHEHPVAYLMAKVLETHDRNRFKVYGYCIGPSKDDVMRERLIEAFDVFVDVYGSNDEDVALLARQDGIDIAIDLTGYTQNSRPGIFSLRPAPIQINYLGFSGTMGAEFIDYIIADPVIIPSDYYHYYSERVLSLPNTFMPTDNTREISSRQITRAEVGLPEKGFVYCCFNNNYKISPREFDIWMRVLTKIEGSVLWLRNSNIWSEKNLLAQVKNRGVDPSRLIFAGRVPMDEHLARQKLADIFLDTFAYNAHTTASEALWAGLPVITKAGKGFSARAAASLLTAIDLPELITETEQDYEALILHLTSNPERLSQIREKLSNNRLTTPLFDTALYTRHLEDGYQQAYQRYYDGEPPQSISVPEHC
jgi:protein O-GlcNAc transferase